MKFTIKPKDLTYLTLGAGGLGLVLRILLYTTGMDDKGLLKSGHVANILIWLLTGLVLAGLFLLTRKITGPERYQDAFPVSGVGAIGSVLAAAGILIDTISLLGNRVGLQDTICSIAGFIAVAALVLTGLCRLGGYKPSFLCHALLSAYFALRLVCQYRAWSWDPQLQDYCFQLFACVGLMLTAYYRAAFEADMGSHHKLWFVSLLTVFLCCMALAGKQDHLFYLTAAVWAWTNLSNLTVRPRRRRPALVLEDEAQKEA